MLAEVLALALAAGPGLPDTLFFKTPERTFSEKFDIALVDGRLWWKPRDKRADAWARIPPDGLPMPKGRLEAIKELTQDLPLAPQPFVRPTKLVSISADGDNLVALSSESAFFYTKLSSGFDWTSVWGPPSLQKPLKLDVLHRAYAMSHRKGPYEDIDGNSHPATAGVSTLYALLADGLSLRFADPWLPADFTHSLCLPKKGRFLAANMAAAGSTLFVIDGGGQMFTRLADFDTVGDDPALPYSYTREKRRNVRSVIRTLPGEDWREQPPISGPHTLKISIVQTGQGNAARELRVEGDGGYWSKEIYAKTWKWIATGIAAPDAYEKRDPQTEGPVKDRTLTAPHAQLADFNPDCSPATLKWKGATIPLHFHGTLAVIPSETRKLEGALLLDAAQRKLLGESAVVEVSLEVSPTEVRLTEKGPPVPGRLSFTFPR